MLLIVYMRNTTSGLQNYYKVQKLQSRVCKTQTCGVELNGLKQGIRTKIWSGHA